MIDVKNYNINKDKIWKTGERVAKEYLEENGYEILETNYRTRYSEIDIIAKKSETLIFVEVRTKTNSALYSPEESINSKKLQKLYFNAQAYINFKKYTGPYRIDAICVVLKTDGGVKSINHYKEI